MHDNVDVPAFGRCDGLQNLCMFSLIVQEADSWNHVITIHSPEVSLDVALLGSITQMEHHPRISHFVLAWGQPCSVSHLDVEYEAILCFEEVVSLIT